MPPVITISVATGLVQGSYRDGQDAPATGSAGRKRFDAFADTQMVTIRLQQNGASASTNIYAVELEARPYDLDSELAS